MLEKLKERLRKMNRKERDTEKNECLENNTNTEFN